MPPAKRTIADVATVDTTTAAIPLQPLDLAQRAWLVKEAKRIQPILQERFGVEAIRPLSLLARLTE